MTSSKKRRTQAERSRQTKQALLIAARKLFSDKGFDGTSTEDILEQAQVSRGALYHHFPSKHALFQAVLEALEQEVKADLDRHFATHRYDRPLDALLGGVEAFLRLSQRADFRAIVLIEGPAVLGFERWHELDARYAVKDIKGGLELLHRRGLLATDDLEVSAYLLHGALNEAALYLAKQRDFEASLERLLAGFRLLLAGIVAGDKR